MSVTTRQGLIDYCLRALGAPVVEINVAEEQIQDRIDEAIEHFRLYHYDGIEKVYLKHSITQQNIDDKYIVLPDLIYGVTKVYPVNNDTTMSRSLFDLQYQLRLNDMYSLTSTSIIYYSQVMNHLALLDNVLNGQQSYRFNKLTNKLYIEAMWGTELSLDTYILVECYRALDPETSTKMYGEKWLKHFATSLIKKQWATNLKKFSGMQLPGGVTIDGNALYDEAIQEIKELEDDIQSKSAPLEFIMG